MLLRNENMSRTSTDYNQAKNLSLSPQKKIAQQEPLKAAPLRNSMPTSALSKVI